MDELTNFNRDRWNALARAGVAYSQPWLDLTPEAARQRVDPFKMLGDLAGQRVLLLSGGGGQQSAALALLGAQVTVLDFSEVQLERDRAALAHYGLPGTVLQGDMRDLSRFPADSFDLVFHPYSINFVPDVAPVFAGVARVLHPGGMYQVTWANPFTKPIDEMAWNGSGYVLKAFYADGEVFFDEDAWEITTAEGTVDRIVGPREFNHTMSHVLNTLAGLNFCLLRFQEDDAGGDPNAEPGSWEHFMAVAPPYLTLWLRLERC